MCLATLDVRAARQLHHVSTDQREKTKVDAVAQKQFSESDESSSSSSHVFHYIASAGLAVLACAAIAAAVYFGWPILLAAGLGLGIFSLLELLNGVEGTIEQNREAAPVQNEAPAEIDPLQEVDPVTLVQQLTCKGLKDEDQFSAEELSHIGRNREGYLTPFKDFFDNYPYEIIGIKREEQIPYSETVFRTYVKRVLGLEVGQDPLERMQACLRLTEEDEFLLKVVPVALALRPGEDLLEKLQSYLSEEDTHPVKDLLVSLIKTDQPYETMKACLEREALRKKALHLHAFFMLIGNKNVAFSLHDFEVTSQFVQKGVAFEPQPTKFGKVAPGLESFGDGHVTCQVGSEKIALKSIPDLGQEDKESLAKFDTTRGVIIFPPDREGNVSYIVNRSFSKAPQ